MDERTIILRSTPGFQGTPAEVLEELASACVLRRFKTGTVLVHPDARPGALYLLTAGLVTLEEGKGRRARSTGQLSPGEAFGHLGNTGLAAEGLVVRAITDVVALEIPQYRARSIVEDEESEACPPLRRALIISLARSVRRREQRMARHIVDLGAAWEPGEEVYAPDEAEAATGTLRTPSGLADL